MHSVKDIRKPKGGGLFELCTPSPQLCTKILFRSVKSCLSRQKQTKTDVKHVNQSNLLVSWKKEYICKISQLIPMNYEAEVRNISEQVIKELC